MKIKIVILFLVGSLLNCYGAVDVYVLLSSSMPKQAIYSFAKSAKKIGASIIFNGLIDDNFTSTQRFTASLIKEAEIGILVDNNIFDDFKVSSVPCVIVADMDVTGKVIKYDKMCGNVTVDYVLEEFKDKGDLAADAKRLLYKLRGGHGRDIS